MGNPPQSRARNICPAQTNDGVPFTNYTVITTDQRTLKCQYADGEACLYSVELSLQQLAPAIFTVLGLGNCHSTRRGGGIAYAKSFEQSLLNSRPTSAIDEPNPANQTQTSIAYISLSLFLTLQGAEDQYRTQSGIFVCAQRQRFTKQTQPGWELYVNDILNSSNNVRTQPVGSSATTITYLFRPPFIPSNHDRSRTKTLSRGTIAGIAVAAAFGIFLILFGCIWRLWRQRLNRTAQNFQIDPVAYPTPPFPVRNGSNGQGDGVDIQSVQGSNLARRVLRTELRTVTEKVAELENQRRTRSRQSGSRARPIRRQVWGFGSASGRSRRSSSPDLEAQLRAEMSMLTTRMNALERADSGCFQRFPVDKLKEFQVGGSGPAALNLNHSNMWEVGSSADGRREPSHEKRLKLSESLTAQGIHSAVDSCQSVNASPNVRLAPALRPANLQYSSKRCDTSSLPPRQQILNATLSETLEPWPAAEKRVIELFIQALAPLLRPRNNAGKGRKRTSNSQAVSVDRGREKGSGTILTSSSPPSARPAVHPAALVGVTEIGRQAAEGGTIQTNGETGTSCGGANKSLQAAACDGGNVGVKWLQRAPISRIGTPTEHDTAIRSPRVGVRECTRRRERAPLLIIALVDSPILLLPALFLHPRLYDALILQKQCLTHESVKGNDEGGGAGEAELSLKAKLYPADTQLRVELECGGPSGRGRHKRNAALLARAVGVKLRPRRTCDRCEDSGRETSTAMPMPQSGEEEQTLSVVRGRSRRWVVIGNRGRETFEGGQRQIGGLEGWEGMELGDARSCQSEGSEAGTEASTEDEDIRAVSGRHERSHELESGNAVRFGLGETAIVAANFMAPIQSKYLMSKSGHTGLLIPHTDARCSQSNESEFRKDSNEDSVRFVCFAARLIATNEVVRGPGVKSKNIERIVSVQFKPSPSSATDRFVSLPPTTASFKFPNHETLQYDWHEDTLA
ncbi:hypothetical protein R3P38DRAFT_2763252 [Favolaschia claudopus]|uniref:Uncharacterized protein n=1 Tax=Favolaschia claudopus TaxID=2862362 RepID=A0AAW0DBY8_9AGAR